MTGPGRQGDRLRRSPLAEETAEAIRLDLSGFEGGDLPPLPALCERYHVSHPIVTKALRLLENEGLLKVTHGRRARVCTGEPAQELERRPGAVERTAHQLANDITEGVYRAGRPLPKLASLADRYRASPGTVSRALDNLERQGVVHVSRRKWHVGRPAPSSTSGRESQPAVAIVSLAAHAWQSLVSPRTEKFVTTFVAEASRQNTALYLLRCLTEADIRPLVKTLGGQGRRYEGALVIGADGRIGLAAATVDALARLGRPTVAFERRPMPPRTTGSWPALYSTCLFSEERFTCAAPRHLYECGHRHMVYVSRDVEPWQLDRGAILQEWARRQAEPVAMGSYTAWIDEIRRKSRDSLARRLEQNFRSRARHVRATMAFLVKHLKLFDATLSWPHPAPSPWHRLADILRSLPTRHDAPEDAPPNPGPLASVLPLPDMARAFSDLTEVLPALMDPRVTAIIFSRDRAVPGVLSAFERVGIEIPRDISAVSYDNDPLTAALPISTVDTGADDLGYRAFHALIRDIPLGLSRRTRNVVARPWIASRGSVNAV